MSDGQAAGWLIAQLTIVAAIVIANLIAFSSITTFE